MHDMLAKTDTGSKEAETIIENATNQQIARATEMYRGREATSIAAWPIHLYECCASATSSSCH